MKKTRKFTAAKPKSRITAPVAPYIAPTFISRISERSTVTRNQIVSELIRSPHGALQDYAPVTQAAAVHDPEFLAHLIAWNQPKGQIRDAKVALPVLSLSVAAFPEDLRENSLAHIALLGPRELEKAYRFAAAAKLPGAMLGFKRLIRRWLAEKDSLKSVQWDRLAIQHRKTLATLYSLVHARPESDARNNILFRGFAPQGSIFETVANLSRMSATEAASSIISQRIPFLIASGALGKQMKEPDVVLALIKAMSPTELVSNTKMLEKLGMRQNPALRGAYEEGLKKVEKSSANILKTSRAADALEESGDVELAAKLRGAQERQLSQKGIEGSWLVLADMSSSMEDAIEASKHVAATLARLVKQKVWLVFFNTMPQTIDVTGLTLDQIRAATRHMRASGSTSIGCGLDRMLASQVPVDGIAVVSDAAENTAPMFADVYKRYAAWLGKEVPVYLFRFKDKFAGHYATRYLDVTMRQAGYQIQEHDIQGVDYYSIPAIVETLRSNPYSLADEILATPLLTINEVLTHTTERKVLVHVPASV